MSEIVVRVEGLSKRYRLGEVERYKTVRESLARLARSALARRRETRSEDRAARELWALRDVSFQVHRGEVLGIIGRNGAGKSTLLKILSRITAPTRGRAEIRGSVGSLLEVGTGFHPELTGRENVYLNGAILGMKRVEVQAKFDAIAEFAEMGRFMDTPVKRYSSGMYTRLAFAVAAFLEPEILVVDEVLAVGDVEFQRKCLGRMDEVARSGRTVLFVSHNMNAVSELCTRALLLDAGGVALDGDVSTVVEAYLATHRSSEPTVDLVGLGRDRPQRYARLRRLGLRNASGAPTTTFVMGEPLKAFVELECLERMKSADVGIKVSSRLGVTIHYLVSSWEGLRGDLEPGRYRFHVRVPRLQLYPGRYRVGVWAGQAGERADTLVADVAWIDVLKGDVSGHPTLVEKYAVSGCEVYTESEWRREEL